MIRYGFPIWFRVFSIGLSLLILGSSPQAFAQDDDASPAAATEEAAFEVPEEEKPFWESAQAFVDAYSARDAEAIGNLFTEDAEFFDELGVSTTGRDNIVARYQYAFESSPEAMIESIHIVGVRHLSDKMALEKGTVVASASADSPRFMAHYHAIHKLGEDGTWRIHILRNSPREDLGRGEQLAQLSWMLGDWINEDPETTVHTTCEWSEDGNFLLRRFNVMTRNGLQMNGVQRTGWDPIHKKLRTWTFDSEGGFFTGFWTKSDAGWILTSAGVTASGETVTSTATYQIIDSEMVVWQYNNLIIGDAVHGAGEPVTMVRSAPSPSLEEDSTGEE
ncbi:SnoaL-like domain protein [Thalassoglobus neptunius]|uniref:SnoaL-like domain protein n=1 Tax=Thalassoglobus neptunius TaxID=1938619 RepID=A0A5C5WH51_9PLAN|nr:SgcJ/EcaC family oxidoreductase [Thalassoglobus neptunius]TWT50108.1 SnoaL-like domain protein [Thalassoglobus neptunius]